MKRFFIYSPARSLLLKTGSCAVFMIRQATLQELVGWFFNVNDHIFLATPLLYPILFFLGGFLYLLEKAKQSFFASILLAEKNVFSSTGRARCPMHFLLVATGWPLVERLEGDWLLHGKSTETHWRVPGARQVKRTLLKRWESIGTRLFHGEGRNVSERSLTFSDCHCEA